MKKIYLSIVAAVSLMFVSCTADWLNTDPSTAVPSDDAIKNIDDAQVALNGIYRLASAHSYYGDNYLYYADCRGEDVQARINKGAGRRVSPYYFFDVTADDNFNLKSATKPLNVLIAFTRPLITEFADNLNLKHPLLPTISPYPTM